MPNYSVILPTFNRANAICEAVESVRNQTRKADEIIVVDDGSTDDTGERLLKFSNDIVVLSQENLGVSAARNAGVRFANCDWLTFLDSDDIWHPNRLAILDRDLNENRAGVHVANQKFIGPDYNVDLFKIRNLRFPSDQATVLSDGFDLAMAGLQINSVAIRRDWIRSIGGFDTTMSIYEDPHLFCRLALLGKWMVTSSLVASVRRFGHSGQNLTNLKNDKKLYTAKMKVKIYDDFAESPKLSETQRNQVMRRLSGAILELAKVENEGGRTDFNRFKTLIRSALRHPSALGWLKILPPLFFGKRGFDYVLDRDRGFRR